LQTISESIRSRGQDVEFEVRVAEHSAAAGPKIEVDVITEGMLIEALPETCQLFVFDDERVTFDDVAVHNGRLGTIRLIDLVKAGPGH